MFKRLIESILRARYGFPTIALFALLVVVVNETTYQNSSFTLKNGIQLTDLRIKAAKALQLVTDAETSVRGYLMTGAVAHLQTYEQALGELPMVRDEVFQLMSQVDGGHTIQMDQVKALMGDKLGELTLLVELKKAGRDAEVNAAILSDVGMKKMVALRLAFDETLAQAAALQQVARVSIQDAMQLSRVVLHLLTALAVLGLSLLTSHLKQADAEKAKETERLEREVTARTIELRELAGYLLSAREDERRRVARELHDDLGALLTAAKLEIARIKRQDALPTPAIERIAAMEKRINEGIALKRRIIENLMPSALDQLGLVASLQLLCKDMNAFMDARIEHDLQDVTVAPPVALTLYRVVQESLTNAAKHAQATRVVVRLQRVDGGIELKVSDDGLGFDPQAVPYGHHGLIGLRYRVESHGGHFTLASAPHTGTTLTVNVPGMDISQT